MVIRKAHIKDIDAVASLFDAYRVFYRKPSDIGGALAFLKDRLSHQDSIIFLAEAEDKSIVGFTQLYPSYSSTKMKRLWILNDLYVDPSYRGQGISKQLIDQAKVHCKQTKAAGLLLETEKSNIIGNQLYPAVGFELETNNFYFWTNP